MGKIHRLAPDLANQIAAGEVVERPASVIKELVENAVDAGATRVTITVEAGGKRLIRVDDDGEGMEPDDARLSVERHATSKIRRADDLERIGTLGFRGEALPSIASVSRFTMRTRTAAYTAGTEIQIDGGGPAVALETGCPVGTSIEVRDLFFNLPARRKFLKTDAAEMAQVTRVVTQLALCYANVGVTLTNAGRKTIEYPPVVSLRDRIFQIYGDRPDLVPVERGGDVRVHGFVAALAADGPVRGPQHVFVNRRAVKDRTITHAIIDAYSQASIKERSPEVHLLIEMPLDAVDVNVHPTKAEVRFRDQSFIHQVVRRAVADAVGAAAPPAFGRQSSLSLEEPHPVTAPLPTPYPSTFPSRWAGESEWRSGQSGGALSFAQTAAEAREALYGAFPAGVTSEAATVEAAPVSADKTLMPLGQFRDTFIVAVDDEGIAIIDQHVAHERILFERITERLTSGRLESQRLLEPMLVELSASGRQTLLAHAADLERLGFEIEEFGGESLRLSACPALLPREEWQPAVRAMAEDLDGLDHGAAVTDALKRIAATMACHAAVKANYPLTPEKMVHILDGLRRTAYSTICPHGRPVMLRLTRRELEKRFENLRIDMRKLIVVAMLAVGVSVALYGQAQAPAAPRFLPSTPPTPLFFREPWRQSAPMDASTGFRPEGGITPAAVTNSALELKIYDPLAANVPAYLKSPPPGTAVVDWHGPSCVQLAGYNQNPAPEKVVAGAPSDPPNLWTGVCQTAVAVTLRHKESFVNLTTPGARIKWVTRTSGFHVVRPVLKLADGSFVVGDSADGAQSANSQLFVDSELAIANVRWLPLDIARVVTRGDKWAQPDLSKVDEVGFADLHPGSGHGWGGFVNVSRIEVYGTPVKR